MVALTPKMKTTQSFNVPCEDFHGSNESHMSVATTPFWASQGPADVLNSTILRQL